MKVKNKWVDTYLAKERISDFSKNSIDKKKVIFKPGTSYIDYLISKNKYEHSNRYIFSPTAFGLKNGEMYYNTYYLMEHDLQYGFTDRFSFTFGTTIIFLPFYVMPMYTFPLNQKSRIAIGNLFLYIYEGQFWGNLSYGLYTHGTTENNFSAGIGIWTYPVYESYYGLNISTNYHNRTDIKTSPVFNLSAQIKISPRAYFLTENYAFTMYTGKNTFYDPDNTGTGPLEHYTQNHKSIFGLTGVRLVRRKNPLASWQFSLLYILIQHGPVPDKYEDPAWDTYMYHEEDDFDFLPLPIIGYSRKFIRPGK